MRPTAWLGGAVGPFRFDLVATGAEPADRRRRMHDIQRLRSVDCRHRASAERVHQAIGLRFC